MARSVMARCIALAAAVVALFALPSAFVPARQGAPAVSPAVAAGVAAGSMALPAWAYDMADAQILLARVPGGKRTKELGLVVPIPEEDGLTDGQIAALFVVALVGLIAAVDLGKTLYYGINPTKFKTAKGKGSITPFMKRLIENGYWVRTCTGRCIYLSSAMHTIIWDQDQEALVPNRNVQKDLAPVWVLGVGQVIH